MRGGAGAAALAGALLVLAGAAAASEPALVLLENGQGLSGLSRRSSDVAASPDGRHVYAVTPGWTIALRREANGKLAVVEEYAIATPGTRVVAPSDGLGLLVLASTSGTAVIVSYLRNGADGKLTGVENEGQNLANSGHSLAASHDGKLVYVTSPGQDAVVAYDRVPATGVLVFAQRVAESDADVSGLVDPTSLAVSPDDRNVYVAAFRRDGDEFFETIVSLRREEDDALRFVGAVDTGPLAGGPGIADLLATPDGAEVLALDSGALAGGGPAVLRFARDPGDGRLSFVAAEPLAEPGFFLGTLYWMALRPDGGRLFAGGLSVTVPSQPTGVVAAWALRNEGALDSLTTVDTQVFTDRGAVSPDGRYVYTNLAQGVRVLVPETSGAAGAAAALAALALGRRGRRAALSA